MPSPPKRRWFAFRLRTLLVVVVVLGAVMTPVAIKVKKAREQKKAVAWVLENGSNSSIRSIENSEVMGTEKQEKSGQYE